MERIIKSTAEAFGATATLRYDLAGSAVINDEQCSEIGQGSVEKILGKEGNYQFEKVTGGEDFCHYLDKVPEFNNPIERTNGLCGLVSLLTNVCKFITIAELTTTASIQFSG